MIILIIICLLIFISTTKEVSVRQHLHSQQSCGTGRQEGCVIDEQRAHTASSYRIDIETACSDL